MAITILKMSEEKPDLRKILILGDCGTGKTTSFRTLPKPALVFSFDLGYASLRGMDGIDVIPLQDADSSKPTAYKDFQAVFKGLNTTYLHTKKDGTTEKYKTIAFDGLGFFCLSIQTYLLYINSLVGKPMQLQLWGQVKTIFSELLRDAILRAEYVCATCLLGTDKDEATGALVYQPAIQGSTKDDLAAWFDVVLYSVKTVGADKKAKYEWDVVGDRQHKAKIRIPVHLDCSLEPKIEQDFEKLFKRLSDAKEKGGQTAK